MNPCGISMWIISIPKTISIKTLIICTGTLRLATHKKETDILANAESIWVQISKNNVCMESNNHFEQWHLVLSI